jgi:hypothetical protein
MRPDTLALLQDLAKEVCHYAKARVEALQIAALIIECHLAPLGRTQGTPKRLLGLGRENAHAALEGNSGLELVRDLVGSVDGPPDLSAGMREPARRSPGSSKKRKGSRRDSVSRQARRAAKPFPDRSAFRRSMPVLNPPLSATVIRGRKDRS